MERVLGFVERICQGRDRTGIELALAEALMNVLEVEWVRLHKCRQVIDDHEVWLAIEVNRALDEHFVDDDWIPSHATPVEKMPLLRTFFRTGVPDPADERILLPIQFETGRWYGFIEVAGESLSVEQLVVAGPIVAIFKNIIALLDYSETDKLTGLLNRKTFDDYLQRFLETHVAQTAGLRKGSSRRKRQDAGGSRFWMGVIDIDHFKRINDNFGHSIGDEVLLLLARLMRTSFRANDLLFRFGGEEFVVLLTSSDELDARAAFERLRAMVEQYRFPLVGSVTASVGYSRVAQTDQPTSIFDRADRALYWAKENGRNRVACFEDLLAQGAVAEKVEAGQIEIF